MALECHLLRPKLSAFARLALILLFCFSLCASVWAKTEAEQKLALEQVRGQIQLLKATLEGQRKAESATRQRLREIDFKVAERASALIELLAQIQSSQQELSVLESEQRALEIKLAGERERLSILLRSAYAVGQLAQIKLALSQERVSQIGRVLAYHGYLNQARIEAIANLSESLDALNKVRAEVDAKRLALEQLAREEDARSAELVSERATRERFLQTLAGELESGSAKLEELEVDRQRLQLLLNQISDVLANLPASVNATFAHQRGRLPWPVSGAVVRRFGELLSDGRSADGISIAAEDGTNVRAVSYGRIAFSDWLRGFGMLTIIDHGDGWMTLYGHLETLIKSEGDWVNAGDLIGTVGASGAAEQSALHFELRRKGLPINPDRWLEGAAK